VPDDEASSGSDAPSGRDGTLRPTVMKLPAGRVRPSRGDAVPAPVAPADASPERLPTTIPGVRRTTFEASPQALRAVAPEAAAGTCEAAASLLAAVPVGGMNERKAVLWGHALQKSYADAMAATLALVQDPLAGQARAHVDRMTQILAAIDLMAACGHGKGGLLARLASPLSDRIDTQARLAAALDELHVLLDHLGAATTGLADLADRLRRHAAAMDRIERDVEAAAVAALFLARHHEREAPELARRFTDRAMSLTATVAQMRQGDAVHRLQLQQPLDLIGVIQDVALVTLPGFLSGLAALLALAGSRGATPTDARDMHHQLRHVLNQLTARET